MPVYRGHPLARCVFCTAAFDPKFRDKCVLSAKLARLGSRVRG
jgi:hypothetical protein